MGLKDAKSVWQIYSVVCVLVLVPLIRPNRLSGAEFLGGGLKSPKCFPYQIINNS